MNISTLRERFAGLTGAEQIALVKAQVVDLETTAATAWLIAKELPSDPLSARRLAFSRWLALTRRMGADS